MVDSTQTTNVPSSSNRVLWSREMEHKLLDLLHEQVQLGRKAEGSFKKEAWTTIERRFNEDLKQNLRKDNLKNKLKTWKVGFRIMKDLRNTSGFAWNEATQYVDVEDSVWNDLLKRKEFKRTRVYKRQPFQNYNELAFIVGNDMADGVIADTAIEMEEGHMMDEALNLDDDRNFRIPVDDNLDDDFSQSNQSTATTKQRISPSSSKKGKRKKASMAGPMDIISEALNKIHEGISKPYVIKVDQEDSDSVAEKIYDALKAIAWLTEDTMIRAYDAFLVETTRVKGFLIMTILERMKYILLKYGSL